jgi:ribokinase
MLLVLGSINTDLLFKVERLPRPGETVLCPGYERAPGGKGANAAAAAAKAGAEVRLVGHVGDDADGPVVRAELAAAGIDVSLLRVSRRPTGIAVIGVDAAGENAIIVGSGANLDTTAAQVEDGLLGPGVSVLCQNEIRAEESWAMLARGRARGARTILNLAPAGPVPAATLAAVDVLVVNEIEAEMAAGGAGASPPDLATTLARRHGLTCVITLGAAGAIAVSPEAGWRARPLRVTPVDTTGAGDCFTGVLAAGLDRGMALPEALRRACVAAALACEKVGAQVAQPTAAQIEARLTELPPVEPLRAGAT